MKTAIEIADVIYAEEKEKCEAEWPERKARLEALRVALESLRRKFEGEGVPWVVEGETVVRTGDDGRLMRFEFYGDGRFWNGRPSCDSFMEPEHAAIDHYEPAIREAARKAVMEAK